MRKLLLFALLCSVLGCQNMSGPFANRSKDRERAAPDPLLSSDLDEQTRYGRSRYSYIEDDRGIAPPGFSGRPTPTGR